MYEDLPKTAILADKTIFKQYNLLRNLSSEKSNSNSILTV